MPGRSLNLAPGLSIPADRFIESATALIGKRGSGKSGGVKVIEEELYRVGLPFITLDPVGVHWGIKSSFDGKSPGLKVLVIGGEHGDLRLDRRAGAQTARAIIEANVSCVIDFSEEPNLFGIRLAVPKSSRSRIDRSGIKGSQLIAEQVPRNPRNYTPPCLGPHRAACAHEGQHGRRGRVATRSTTRDIRGLRGAGRWPKN